MLANGKTGYFDPCNTVPFIEPKSSPDGGTPKKSITRKGMSQVVDSSVKTVLKF